MGLTARFVNGHEDGLIHLASAGHQPVGPGHPGSERADRELTEDGVAPLEEFDVTTSNPPSQTPCDLRRAGTPTGAEDMDLVSLRTKFRRDVPRMVRDAVRRWREGGEDENLHECPDRTGISITPILGTTLLAIIRTTGGRGVQRHVCS
ncbi:unannotated protein [freshwater metagenome]|uniref:Unannotated protein n=1 Tax=freshwater metagenome TaxID=449393 RepID=A0A6J6XDV4_9ZZZZ